jgi:DNA-binding NtrC family response regulator
MAQPQLEPLTPPILVVDPDADQLMLAEKTLSGLGVGPVATLRDRAQVRPFLAKNRCVLVMLSVAKASDEAAELVGHIVCDHPSVSVVVTGANDVSDAVACIRSGASDYLARPLAPERLLLAARRALGMRPRVAEPVDPATSVPEVPGIVTVNAAMHRLLRYLRAIAASPLPLLITGETGTGKELAARAVHALALRRGAFLCLDSATLESALAGDLGVAAGGTIYIDEIAALSANAQSRLLRLLHEQELAVLTADPSKRTAIRVIAATGRDPRELRATGALREDLHFRLRVHHAHLPPLRARRDDVPLLVDHFLGQACKQLSRERPAVPPGILELLAQYPFPGNARELRCLVYDALSRTDGSALSLEPFACALDEAQTAPGQQEARRVLASLPLLPTLKEIQALVVDEALRRTNQHQSSAAGLLGITRQALNKRLRGRGKRE